MANWSVLCCEAARADKLTIWAALMYFPNPAAILDVTARGPWRWTAAAAHTLNSAVPVGGLTVLLSPDRCKEWTRPKMTAMRGAEPLEAVDVCRSAKGTCKLLSYRLSLYSHCHDTMLSERRRCGLFLFLKHMHFARGPQLEAGESNHKRRCTSAIKSEWCSHLIVSLPHSASRPPSCWECCHGSGSELSGSVHPSLSLNYGCAAEIANQPLRSAGEEEEIVWIYFD